MKCLATSIACSEAQSIMHSNVRGEVFLTLDGIEGDRKYWIISSIRLNLEWGN